MLISILMNFVVFIGLLMNMLCAGYRRPAAILFISLIGLLCHGIFMIWDAYVCVCICKYVCVYTSSYIHASSRMCMQGNTHYCMDAYALGGMGASCEGELILNSDGRLQLASHEFKIDSNCCWFDEFILKFCTHRLIVLCGLVMPEVVILITRRRLSKVGLISD